MGKLEAALAWSRRGFRVFPLNENSKLPVSGLSHPERATTDEGLIREWWRDPVLGFERDYNVGFSTTGYVVVDVDVKSGKQGLETARQLGLEWGTLVIKTPSGGYHLYYAGPGYPIGQSPLGPGVDVRAQNGYVVAPGSIIDGMPYEIVLDDDLAPLPARVLPLLKAPQERRREPLESFDDSPIAINIATEYLKTASNAEKGNRGWTCYKVACRLRDYGISPFTAAELLRENWNERNQPPMDFDELSESVTHAYRYARGELGAAAPTAAFQATQPVTEPIRAVRVSSGLYGLGNLLDEDSIAARPWLCGQWLLRRAVTTLIAAPGGGKSLFTLILACHGAAGRSFAGQAWAGEPIKALVYDAEDDIAEMSRRVHAICLLYNLDSEAVRHNLSINGAEETGLMITKGSPPTINLEKVQELIDRVKEQGIAFIGIGPLADIHTANENDNPQMHYVMSILAHIARETNTAVMTAHHTAKPPLVSSASWSGSQFAGRGATSVPAKARIVLTLFPASTEDASEGSVPTATKSTFVKLDTGKMSYGKPQQPTWFQWASVRLRSSDEVGVLLVKNAQQLRDEVAASFADTLFAEMVRRSVGSLKAEEAFAVMRREDVAEKNESAHSMRNRLTRFLERGAKTSQGLTLTCRKTPTLEVVVA